MENKTKHKFVIDKWKRNGKITKLTVRKRTVAFTPIFTIKIDPPVSSILFKVPEWVKDFVHRMNIGEIKIRMKMKDGAN